MTGPLSTEHKAQLAMNRTEAKYVEAYLDWVRSDRRGRKADPAEIEKRINAISHQLDDNSISSLKRLKLMQQRVDLIDKLARTLDAPDRLALEAGFIDNAAAYGERMGIDYETWREFGVKAAVLRRAGIS